MLDILPKNIVFSEMFDSDFLYVEVCFTDQNYKRLLIEDRMNHIKNDMLLISSKRSNICKVKDYGLLPFARNTSKIWNGKYSHTKQ